MDFELECPVVAPDPPDMSLKPNEDGKRLDCCPCSFKISFSSSSSFSVCSTFFPFPNVVVELVLVTFFAFEKKGNPRFVLDGVFGIEALEVVLTSPFRNPVSAFAVLFRFGLFTTLLSILLDEEDAMVGVADVVEFPSPLPVVNKMDLEIFLLMHFDELCLNL